MNARQLVKLFMPPLFVQAYRVLRYGKESSEPPQEGLHLTGDYPSWRVAMADSTGYDADVILEKTRTALLKVKNGEAVYERDSVIFEEIQYAWPLLAGLMWVAARCGGSLNVLDFGGSLGSTYFQNRAFLAGLREVRWNIVEQARHVEMGKRWFEDGQLKFYRGIEECLAETQPQVVILSGVLQYLERPYELLKQVLSLPFHYMIIDRTSFGRGKTDRLCVQRVPSAIFEASYPAWVFSLDKFRAFFAQHTIVAEFMGFESDNESFGCEFRGFIIDVQRSVVHDAAV